jgi:hypothetical protein
MGVFRKLLYPIFAVVTIAVPVLVFAGPASAATGTICTVNGAHNCVGTDAVQRGIEVETKNPPGRTYEYTGDIGGTGLLEYASSGGTVCVQAVSNTYGLKNSACGGITGIVWSLQDCGTGCRKLVNIHFSGREMASDNVVGDVVIASPCCLSGWYYKMQPLN